MGVFTTYASAKWVVTGHRTYWEQRANPDDQRKLQRRRKLEGTVYKECDAYSAALSGGAFYNLGATATNLVAYVGESGTGGEHTFTFGGVWEIENCDVYYSDNVAHITQTITRYSSDWTDVDESIYVTTTTTTAP